LADRGSGTQIRPSFFPYAQLKASGEVEKAGIEEKHFPYAPKYAGWMANKGKWRVLCGKGVQDEANGKNFRYKVIFR
jgi:hypothetical protein